MRELVPSRNNILTGRKLNPLWMQSIRILTMYSRISAWVTGWYSMKLPNEVEFLKILRSFVFKGFALVGWTRWIFHVRSNISYSSAITVALLRVILEALETVFYIFSKIGFHESWKNEFSSCFCDVEKWISCLYFIYLQDWRKWKFVFLI